MGLVLRPAFSQSIERRYDNNEIKVDESKHDQQFFNFVTVRHLIHTGVEFALLIPRLLSDPT